MIEKGDLVYILIDKKTKMVIGVYDGMYEVNRVIGELGGPDKIYVQKRLLGYDVYH